MSKNIKIIESVTIKTEEIGATTRYYPYLTGVYVSMIDNNDDMMQGVTEYENIHEQAKSYIEYILRNIHNAEIEIIFGNLENSLTREEIAKYNIQVDSVDYLKQWIKNE